MARTPVERTNDLGQPIGFAVEDWTPCERPPRTAMEGRLCRVEPLDPDRHGAALFASFIKDREHRVWTYMAYGPFETEAEFRAWLERECTGDDPLFHAIVDQESGRALGMASYLRIDPPVGVIEVGHINFAPALQRTPMATECMALMMGRVFDDLGYRRYEWKCDRLNAPSQAAAARLGFTFEGVFRQATIYKGRNRDTAWYSVLDHEWPFLKDAFAAWLDPGNFDSNGRQLRRLGDLRPVS